MTRLTAQAIDVTLGNRQVLDQVDLAVASGEVVGLLGPNGAGKSTLLRVLAGVLKPQSGQVGMDGQAGDTIPRAQLAKQIAFLS